MDEFAFRDIPDTIEYVLNATHSKSLSYIGFSQGTAQAFAALSIHPTLNEKVNLYIALAPAMSPAGLSTGVVDAMVKASPNVLFLLFGRMSILSSATMWQEILYPPLWVRLIDVSLTFLFNWRGDNIALNQKMAAYSHLYSFTSTKSVVHWFQIMRSESFQMYDDEGTRPFHITSGAKYYKVARYPTQNIKVPVMLLWGGRDSLVDIKTMLKELPKHTKEIEVPHYEHLDFLWANGVEELVFPHIFRALDLHSNSNLQLNLTAPRPKRVFSVDGTSKEVVTVKVPEEAVVNGEADDDCRAFSEYNDTDKARAFDHFISTLGESEVRKRISSPVSPLPQPFRRASALRKASQLSTRASTTASSPPLTPSDSHTKIKLPNHTPAPFVYRSGSGMMSNRLDQYASPGTPTPRIIASPPVDELAANPLVQPRKPLSPSPANSRRQAASSNFTPPSAVLGDGAADLELSDSHLHHKPSPVRDSSNPSSPVHRDCPLQDPINAVNGGIAGGDKEGQMRNKPRTDSASSEVSQDSGRTLNSIRGSEAPHAGHSNQEPRKPSFKTGGIHLPPSTAASSVTTSEAETAMLQPPKPDKKARKRKNHNHNNHNSSSQKHEEGSVSVSGASASVLASASASTSTS